jgi:AraC-like DNA-binding protein
MDAEASGEILDRRQLARALALIDARLDSTLSVAELARECHLSASRFAYAFKLAVGMSPHRWLIARRIERAKLLLRQADTPLARVALASGFADQSHFTHVFTALVGMPPGEWRRSAIG